MQSDYTKWIKELGLAVLVVTGLAPAALGESRGLETVIETELRPLMRKEQMLEAVRASNVVHGADTQEQILAMDREWREQVGKDQQVLIKKVLEGPVSQMLRSAVSNGKGLISEVIVMDAKGLTVGCWPATSDYYQGDEEQYQMTFLKGADARHLGPERLDDSTRMAQRQLSLTLVDPTNGTPIGAITFGLNADNLK